MGVKTSFSYQMTDIKCCMDDKSEEVIGLTFILSSKWMLVVLFGICMIYK